MLTSEEMFGLTKQLAAGGMPLTFNGDRFDAFKHGADFALKILAQGVTLDSKLDQIIQDSVKKFVAGGENAKAKKTISNSPKTTPRS